MRKLKITTEINKKQFCLLVGALSIMLGVFGARVTAEGKADTEQKILAPITIVGEPVEVITEEETYIDTFSTMSTDWGVEVYEQGFKYYQIPEEYVREGGYLPEDIQVYIWGLCEERGLDYYTVLALIEREKVVIRVML